jgi:hypothetical protein
MKKKGGGKSHAFVPLGSYYPHPMKGPPPPNSWHHN